MKKIATLIWIPLLLTLLACNRSTKTDSQPTVTVSIIPQQFFVNQIAGDWLSVNVMIPPGGSPATYEPTPMQMKELSRSLIYFQIGHIAFEKSWADKLQSVSPNTKFVDTSADLDLISEEAWDDEEAAHHQHEGHHHHEGFNPHVWLSPAMVKKQAEIIYKTLTQTYPEHRIEMKANFERFAQQCDSVQGAMDSLLKNAKGSNFIVYHPVWSYLARDYQLNEIAIEHNGKEATADKLKKIIDFATENKVRVVFVQKEFSSAQAQTIADQIQGEVLVMNPLDYNWFHTMKAFGEAFNKMGRE